MSQTGYSRRVMVQTASTSSSWTSGGIFSCFSRRYSRYIFRQLLAVFLLITLTLTCIVWLSQSLRFIDMIVNRGLSIGVFLKFAGLLIPSLLHILIPIAVFFTVVFIYHRLNLDSELVVLRGTGSSPLQLGMPAFTLAVLICALGYFISVYAMPASYRSFKDLQNEIRDNYSSTLLQEGVFTELGPAITVYIQSRASDGTLKGILVHDNRLTGEKATIVAETGQLISTPSGPKVTVENGSRQVWDTQNQRLTTLYFEEYTIDLQTFSGGTMGNRWREPRERFLPELLHPDASRDDQNNKNELLVEFHNRILTPLYSVMFAAVGLCILLLGEFPRRSHGGRLWLAVLMVFSLQGVAMMMQNLSSKMVMLIPLMYVSCLLPLGIAVWFLAKPSAWQRISGWRRARSLPTGEVA